MLECLICGTFQGWDLRVCCEVWEEEWMEMHGGGVKEAVSRKKDAHKAMCGNCTEEHKKRYKSRKNKAASRVLREKAEKALTELKNCPIGVF